MHAQVIRDGSIGPAGGALSGPNYQIPASLGSTKGGNLFHSFQKFDLQVGDSANFTAGGARNILARVTDRNPSSINGAINADANLFLMNPAGIVFGESASVNVTGSFFATTADYIKLGVSGRFSAKTAPHESILTVSDPSAFGFLTPNPAAIRVNGSQLAAPGVKTMGFVGGDVTVDNGAYLQAEDVQIVSVRAVGEAALRLPTDTNGLRYASINADNFSKRGAVAIGTPVTPDQPAPPRTTVAGNRIVIRGGTLAVKNADVYASANNPGDGVSMRAAGELTMGDFAFVASFNAADLRGQPTIEVAAQSMSMDSFSQIVSFTFDPGSGGDLRLNVNGSLSMRNGASIVTQSSSSIQGGDVYIEAGNLLADSSAIFSQADGLAKTGDITLKVAGALSLTHSATVAIYPLQSSNERLEVTAGDIAIVDPGSGLFFLDQVPEGLGGAISVVAQGTLSILDGGQIRALTANRTGASIDVSAQNVLISATGTPGIRTGISAETIAALDTQGGDIRVNVSNLLQVLDGGGISTNALNLGNAGSISISARDVVVTGPQAPSADFFFQHGITSQNVPLAGDGSSGNSGSLSLSLSGKLEVRDGGLVAVDTRGTGRGGSIDITASELFVASHGIIAARTLLAEGGGAGGDVTINASGRMEVGAGGEVNAGTLGSGAGGTVSIHADEIVANGGNARISAVSGSPQAPATGAGGNVLITVNGLQIGNDAQITASTFGPGAGGNVNVTTNTLSIVDSDGAAFAGISAQTLSTGAGGPGGTVQVDARSIAMSGAGAAITTQSLGGGLSGQVRLTTDTLAMSGGSTVQSSSSGSGNAGSVAIDANGSITFNSGSTVQSSSTGTGNAGSITIEANGDITLAGGSSFSVAAAQSNAGDIHVRSAQSITLTDSSITAEAALNGGNIDIRAVDTLFLTNSQITAAAGVNGGNIFIDPVFVILDQSLISANAILGRGGNIRIISDFFLAPFGSRVTATSQLGIDGTVHIDALNTDLTGSLVELPDSLINAESLLQELCTVKVDAFSSFISEGRGGLPPLPGEALPSLMIVK